MSTMRTEALSAPDRVAEQLTATRPHLEQLAQALRARPPAFAMTVARGSSDHAAGYARYLFETALGLVTASAAPSVVTCYGARLRVGNALALAISQSGQSPDLVATLRATREAGACTVAVVNTEGSPLAEAAEHVVPMLAGPETAVAATKSFIASLAAVAALVAAWREDAHLAAALDALPGRLRQACALDWSAARPVLAEAESLLVVGRGYALPVAQEMAHKGKETCTLHAEPFSAAELLHGPVALVDEGFPVLLLAMPDETLDSALTTARRLREQGAHLLVASAVPEALALADTPLPLPEPLHPMLDPIMAVQAFYPMIGDVAADRGFDPDRPRFLRKVTHTV
ncbi:MAG TPA: SIS domain-containing protein [Azospirillum sp.]|nr:SIS domain-containing protein [Azospirillum sp.]